MEQSCDLQPRKQLQGTEFWFAISEMQKWLKMGTHGLNPVQNLAGHCIVSKHLNC